MRDTRARVDCGRSCLRGLLRALNYLLAIIGVLMVAYALFMWVQWSEAAASPPAPAPEPAHHHHHHHEPPVPSPSPVPGPSPVPSPDDGNSFMQQYLSAKQAHTEQIGGAWQEQQGEEGNEPSGTGALAKCALVRAAALVLSRTAHSICSNAQRAAQSINVMHCLDVGRLFRVMHAKGVFKWRNASSQAEHSAHMPVFTGQPSLKHNAPPSPPRPCAATAHRSPSIKSAPMPHRYPWFIYVFGSAGLFVFLTASVGILSADCAGCGVTCLLGLYHALMVLLLLIQISVICFYFFDNKWESDLPKDTTGALRGAAPASLCAAACARTRTHDCAHSETALGCCAPPAVAHAASRSSVICQALPRTASQDHLANVGHPTPCAQCMSCHALAQSKQARPVTIAVVVFCGRENARARHICGLVHRLDTSVDSCTGLNMRRRV